MTGNISFDANNEHELTDIQEKFVYAMLTLPTVTEACRSISVASETGYRWLKLPHIQEAYSTLRKETFNIAMNRLLTVVDKSISTLESIMEDKDAPHMARVNCAKTLLEKAIEVHRTEDLEARIKAIEATFK
jgi:phage terminase small subunit